MAEILKGGPVAKAITENLVPRCIALKEKGIVPCLAILRIGERGDDIAYESSAVKCCEKIGIKARLFTLPSEASKEEVLNAIRKINADDTIHGCLMFRPLSDRQTEAEACSLLDPAKDVDAMTMASLAGVFACRDIGYPPCTAQAVIELLNHYQISLEGKRVTVIGRSMVIGKPVSMMLQKANATVTMCHTRTVDLPGVCRNAEVLVVAAGHAGVVDASYFSEKQVIVDVGINVGPQGNLCGDVKYEEAESLVKAITPVPGGVGSVTTAVLCKHVIEAAEKTLK